MDIEEYKKLAKNKIEADDLTRQVRNVIKKTKWQKQDIRERFTETFKPLIESQESVKKSIDEQQNKTIAQLQANQLAFTQVLNQLTLTQGLNQNRLNKNNKSDEKNEDVEETDKENEDVEETDEKYEDAEEFLMFKDFDRYLTSKEVREILNKNYYFYLPSEFARENLDVLDKFANNVSRELDEYYEKIKNFSHFYGHTRYIQATPLYNNISKKNLEDLYFFNVLSVYSRNLNKLYNKLYNEKLSSN